MKIKALQCIAGVNFVVNAGEETERFSNEEAIRFIEAGFAVPVTEEKKERAVKAAPEKREGVLARAKKAILGE